MRIVQTNIDDLFPGKSTETIRMDKATKKGSGFANIQLERIYGIWHGATGFQGNQYSEVTPNNFNSPIKTQKYLADELGITVQTLHNYKALIDLIPEVED